MNEDGLNSNKDIIKYRLQKSKELLEEIQFLLEGGYANASISRMYYAGYHAISALLFSYGIETKTHRGLRLQFNNHFVKTHLIEVDKAKVFAEIADKRHQSDYDDFMDFTIERAKEIFPDIVELVTTVHRLTKTV